MLFWILACLGLYLFNVYGAGSLLMLRIGPAAYMGPRDTLPEPSKYYGRMQKAAANFGENLPVFLALAVLALVIEGVDMALAERGAMLFVLARVVYIAVYVAGVPFVRSVIFTAGLAGQVMMLLALL